MSKFVIFGANGVLGKRLALDLKQASHEVVTVTRQDFDVLNKTNLTNFLSTMGEAIIVNCIGYMPADKCELEPEQSQNINVEFVETLAIGIAQNSGQKLVQFSSDFIFDGNGTIPYEVDSAPNPKNVYGIHKYEAEKVVAARLPGRNSIIRFASLVSKSNERKTFLEKVIDRALTSGKASVVGDLAISTATSDLISSVVSSNLLFDTPIIHAVHRGETSWFEIAKVAFEALEIEIEIEKVSSNQFPAPAKRPAYSVLKPSEEVLEMDSRKWSDAVREYALLNLRSK